MSVLLVALGVVLVVVWMFVKNALFLIYLLMAVVLIALLGAWFVQVMGNAPDACLDTFFINKCAMLVKLIAKSANLFMNAMFARLGFCLVERAVLVNKYEKPC